MIKIMTIYRAACLIEDLSLCLEQIKVTLKVCLRDVNF